MAKFEFLFKKSSQKEKTRKKFHIKRDNKYNSCKKIPILGKNIKNIKNQKEKISKNIQND